jgi:hypothetical protein
MILWLRWRLTQAKEHAITGLVFGPVPINPAGVWEVKVDLGISDVAQSSASHKVLDRQEVTVVSPVCIVR